MPYDAKYILEKALRLTELREKAARGELTPHDHAELVSNQGHDDNSHPSPITPDQIIPDVQPTPGNGTKPAESINIIPRSECSTHIEVEFPTTPYRTADYVELDRKIDIQHKVTEYLQQPSERLGNKKIYEMSDMELVEWGFAIKCEYEMFCKLAEGRKIKILRAKQAELQAAKEEHKQARIKKEDAKRPEVKRAKIQTSKKLDKLSKLALSLDIDIEGLSVDDAKRKIAEAMVI